MSLLCHGCQIRKDNYHSEHLGRFRGKLRVAACMQWGDCTSTFLKHILIVLNKIPPAWPPVNAKVNRMNFINLNHKKISDGDFDRLNMRPCKPGKSSTHRDLKLWFLLQLWFVNALDNSTVNDIFEVICSGQLVVAHSLRDWYFNKSIMCDPLMSPGDRPCGCKDMKNIATMPGTRARNQHDHWWWD